MKALPTLDRRIRIDVEDALDLLVLRSIVADAQRDDDLAAEVCGHIADELREDWQDLVMPELRSAFHEQLQTVVDALSDIGPGDSVFIGPEDGEAWYGALNQARLAMEDLLDGADRWDDELERDSTGPAAVRARFYQMLQQLLLEFILDAGSS